MTKSVIGNLSKRVLGVRSKLPINGDAFKFLDKCAISSDFDWTSAYSISKPSTFVTNFQKNFDPEKLKYYPKLISGSPFLRKTVTDYFFTQRILCNEANIIIDDSVFVILRQIYEILNLKRKKQKVLIPTPTFGYYYMQCHKSGIKTEFLPTKIEDGWKIIPEQLDKTLKENPEIGLILLNYPSNPTGVVMTESYGNSLAEVLKLYPNINIVCDEMFQDIVLNPKIEQFSIGSIAEIADRVITLSGVSKSRGLDDFRTSFACAPERISRKYDYSAHMMGFSSFLHDIAAHSIIDNQENREYLSENIKKYQKNIEQIKEQIDLLNKKLSKHFNEDGEVYIKPYIPDPEAGNVYLVDFTGLKEKVFTNGKKLKTGLEVAEFILETARVAMVPGECFFIPENDMVLRLATSTPIEEIEKGFEKISEVIIDNLHNSPKTKISESRIVKMSGDYMIRE